MKYETERKGILYLFKWVETKNNIDRKMPHRKIFIGNNTHWCSVVWHSIAWKFFLIYTINYFVVVSNASVHFTEEYVRITIGASSLKITQIRIAF